MAHCAPRRMQRHRRAVRGARPRDDHPLARQLRPDGRAGATSLGRKTTRRRAARLWETQFRD
eukprot:5627012-Alexandrium_andersonii.AAC.1